MSDQIKLDDCPEILKAAVKAELAKRAEYSNSVRIISCTALKSSYEARTTFRVCIMTYNTFIILTYIDDPGHYDVGVMSDMVTIGDIKEIIRSAPEYFG